MNVFLATPWGCLPISVPVRASDDGKWEMISSKNEWIPCQPLYDKDDNFVGVTTHLNPK